MLFHFENCVASGRVPNVGAREKSQNPHATIPHVCLSIDLNQAQPMARALTFSFKVIRS
eukprot:m.4178 g.4178  ORF g.4178 m.4178 type:complete len:59 (-) comp4137_c0_seq1:8-184(-)